MDRRIIILAHDTARQRAHQAIDCAPPGWSVIIGPQKRSLAQNARFHAICHDLERSGLPFAGKPRSLAEWKALLVSGHAVATKQGGEVIPGIEGEFVAIRESTARMSKDRLMSLIEYSEAFCAEHEIALRECWDR